jgi:hypothetical protein
VSNHVWIPPAQELTLEARAAALAATGAQLQQAGSAVVVGGGSVGVELAAELAAHFGTRCRVTLVTSSSRWGAPASQAQQHTGHTGPCGDGLLDVVFMQAINPIDTPPLLGTFMHCAGAEFDLHLLASLHLHAQPHLLTFHAHVFGGQACAYGAADL